MIKSTSWFWTLQITFWFLVGGVNFCVQYFAGGFAPTLALLNMTGLSFGGFCCTLAYRSYIKRRKFDFNISRLKLIGHILVSVLIQSFAWISFMVILSLPFIEKYNISLVKILLNLIPVYVIALSWNLVYLGYHLVRNFHKSEVEKWKIDSEFQKAQLGALKSQVNPHFMFNAINNIRALILENPTLAREMLTNFADIFRHSLQYSNEAQITLNEELEMINSYLQIHKLQFEEKLQYLIKVDPLLERETLPPMILQLLVENAIKHGISKNKKGGEISITINKIDETLYLSVKNTGTFKTGPNIDGNLGIGLQNIRERLMLTYGQKASLSFTESPPFVTICISITK